LARELTPFLAAQGITEPDQDYLARVVPTLSARCKTLVEMAAAARFYFLDPRPYEEKAAKKFLTLGAVPMLKEIAARLDKLPDPSEEALNRLFTDLAQTTGQKMTNLAQPVRVALTAKTASPGLYEIIHILGREEALRRIQHAIEFAAQSGA
ncbi:MAG: glutamate--tRNA ligase, partial [Proteobacteria bacterium]|nr:glutamate--tRNA ligase [Pseudomonadota bacterium]